MNNLLKKYQIHLLVAIFSLMIGALMSAVIINSRLKQVAVVDLERILDQKAKEYSKIDNEEEREKKLSSLTVRLKQSLPNLGSKLVVNHRCILHVNSDYRVLDKTNLVMKKLP